MHDFRQSNEKLKGTREDATPGIKMDVFGETDKYHDARQCWDDIPRLKELAQGRPIYLKGVCHIDVSHCRVFCGCSAESKGDMETCELTRRMYAWPRNTV